MRGLFFLPLIILLFAPLGAATAQSSTERDAKIALAKEVIELTRATVLVEEGFSSTLEEQKKAFLEQAGDELPKERRREIDLTIQYLAQEIDEIFPDFFEDVTELYADQFTLEDLKAVRDFYASDVGQRFARGSFDLSAQIGALGQEWFAGVATDAARRARARAIETIKQER